MDQAPLTKVNFLTSPIDAHEHPCQVLPFRQVYFTVRYTLPGPEIVRRRGHRLGRHRKSSASSATTKRSRPCDDQALEEETPVPRSSLPHYLTHSLLITPSADLRRRFLTPSFSPIERNNSPVSTRQSNGIIPHPSRPLARLICAEFQALGDKSARVEAWSRVRVRARCVSQNSIE